VRHSQERTAPLTHRHALSRPRQATVPARSSAPGAGGRQARPLGAVGDRSTGGGQPPVPSLPTGAERARSASLRLRTVPSLGLQRCPIVALRASWRPLAMLDNVAREPAPVAGARSGK